MQQVCINRVETGLTEQCYENTRAWYHGVELWACPESILFDYILQAWRHRRLPPMIRHQVERAIRPVSFGAKVKIEKVIPNG